MIIAWLMSVVVFSEELSSHSLNIFKLLSRPSCFINKKKHLIWNQFYPHITYYVRFRQERGKTKTILFRRNLIALYHVVVSRQGVLSIKTNIFILSLLIFHNLKFLASSIDFLKVYKLQITLYCCDIINSVSTFGTRSSDHILNLPIRIM